MSKFKVGDRVRSISPYGGVPDWHDEWPEAVVCKIDGETVYIERDDGVQGSAINGWWKLIEPATDTTSPTHYQSGGMECIDAIRAALTPEEFGGYCKGNMLKYAWRERNKGGDEDLRKAAVYAGFATEQADG